MQKLTSFSTSPGSLHTTDIALRHFGMIHYRAGVVLTYDTSRLFLYTSWGIPWFVDVLGWVLLQHGKVFPGGGNENMESIDRLVQKVIVLNLI